MTEYDPRLVAPTWLYLASKAAESTVQMLMKSMTQLTWCYGPGSCPSKRVAWARELIDEEAEQFLMPRFIDPDSERPWLAQRMALTIPYSA
ncbi:pectinesterase 31-like [Quercus robur]|uniref:pectinesterase 31-like n=1 Tax=Quercus robur TaxID=38942 RepID=UPI00216358E1|nr:pectinesterase 31-like [Quercus robur]